MATNSLSWTISGDFLVPTFAISCISQPASQPNKHGRGDFIWQDKMASIIGSVASTPKKTSKGGQINSRTDLLQSVYVSHVFIVHSMANPSRFLLTNCFRYRSDSITWTRPKQHDRQQCPFPVLRISCEKNTFVKT